MILHKKGLLAVVTSMVFAGNVFAACSADINMGGQNITHIGTNDASTNYHVATKGDLLAGSRLEASSISDTAVAGFGAAAAYCTSLADDGDATTGGGNWRLPANLAEASVAITGDTTGSSIASASYIWTADALNKADQAPNEAWSTNGYGFYLLLSLDGNWNTYHHSDTTRYAGCVR